jgi:hypothetical protein
MTDYEARIEELEGRVRYAEWVSSINIDRARAAEARAERYRVAMIEAQCWAGEHSYIDVHNVLTAALNDAKPEGGG